MGKHKLFNEHELLKYCRFYDGTDESVKKADPHVGFSRSCAIAESAAIQNLGTEGEQKCINFWDECGSPGIKTGIPAQILASLWGLYNKHSDMVAEDQSVPFETEFLPFYTGATLI